MWTPDDLLSGLIPLGVYLAVLGVIVGIAMWWARRHHSSTLALSATRSIAGMFLGLVVLGVLFGSFNTFLNSRFALDGELAQWVTENRSSLLSPDCDSGVFYDRVDSDGSALIGFCSGGVEHAPLAPRVVFFVGTVLVLLAAAAIAWSIYTAALLASMREPFHPSVPRTFRLAAIVVLATVVVGDVFTTIGMTLAARSLEWSPGVTVPFVFQPPVWPLAVALGLFALSAIFRYGAQLQRETEGLI